jgi:sugar O-acyltransferase (sialic acid O-acetyltransferase NeuD family)
MVKKRVLILGTGGNCIDILDTMLEINTVQNQDTYECVGFLDDNSQQWGKTLYGVPVRGPLASATEYPDCCFVNGIGSPLNFWKKQEIIAKTGLMPDRFETIIHPTASVSRFARLGQGVVILPHVTIASGVQMGNHIIVLPNSIVSHDDLIGDYTCIAGGVCISGGVTVGASCYLGTNASIRGNIRVGDYSLIGMGSVVLNDVPENTVVVGNPARFLRKTIAGEK